MKHLKQLVAILLVTTFFLSACSVGDTSWAFRSGEEQISSGLYILYEIASFGEAEEKYAEETEGYIGMQPTEFLKQTVEGKPASDWIQERAAQLAREHIAVQGKLASLGISLNDAELASIESSIGSIKASGGDFYEKNGVSEVTLREYYTGYARKNRLFLSLYGEGGEFAVSDEELKSYFADKYAMIDALIMYKTVTAPEGETKTVEQLVSEERSQAQDYFTRLKAGEEIEQLVYEWQQSQVSEDQKANVTKPEKGQLNMIIAEASRANYGDALTDAAFGTNIGESQMVEDDDFFFVLKKLDIMTAPEEFDRYKPSVLMEMKNDEYEAKLADWSASTQIETNDASIGRYKPEKIKFD